MLGVLVSLVLAGRSEAHQTLAAGTAQHLALGQVNSVTSSDAFAFQQLATEDARFWKSEWAATEATLMRLLKAAQADSGAVPSRVLVNLQISTSPSNSSKTLATGAAADANARDTKAMMKALLRGSAHKSTPAAELAPTLAMLDSLYADIKDRIGQLNTREQKSKAWFENITAEHEAKLATIEARFKNKTLSQEFRTNETHDEARMFAYWQRTRERQHRQFHINLEIQHGTMEKVKKMIGAYQATISGKADAAEVKKTIDSVAGRSMPMLVLLQNVREEVTHYCLQTLEDVRRERATLAGSFADAL